MRVVTCESSIEVQLSHIHTHKHTHVISHAYLCGDITVIHYNHTAWSLYLGHPPHFGGYITALSANMHQTQACAHKYTQTHILSVYTPPHLLHNDNEPNLRAIRLVAHVPTQFTESRPEAVSTMNTHTHTHAHTHTHTHTHTNGARRLILRLWFSPGQTWQLENQNSKICEYSSICHWFGGFCVMQHPFTDIRLFLFHFDGWLCPSYHTNRIKAERSLKNWRQHSCLFVTCSLSHSRSSRGFNRSTWFLVIDGWCKT